MTTILPGLCSVTFRQLGVDDVIAVASNAGMQAVEWGADVHLRPGDSAFAARVRGQCADVGIACPSYGSYFFAGKSPDDELVPLLANAVALGASTVRVWAPGDPRPQYWHESAPVVEALVTACEQAAEHELTIAVEFHPNTLTATARSTRELIADVDRPNFRTYWQPLPGATGLHALTELDPVLSHLQNLHVFSWNEDSSRLPLVAHEDLWQAVLAKVAEQQDDRTACAYLEFVEGDDPAVLARDGATLRGVDRQAVVTRERPVVVLAMWGDLAPHLLDEHLPRLRAIADVPDALPLERFDDERADALLGSAEVLFTGWLCPPLTAEVLDRAPNLALVAHAAGTVKDHITPEVWERGIHVSTAAAANAVPVAEFSLAAILFANKHVFASRERFRKRRTEMLLPTAAGNRNKTIGIVGASRVGRHLIELLRPFDLDVVVSDPLLTLVEADALRVELVSLQELLDRSDVVSLHVPAVPSTKHMIGEKELARMRDGATLINTARGSVVDHDALATELQTRRLNAVLDVTEPEPLPEDSPLFDMPNVFLTPHIAGAAGSEIPRLAEMAIDEVERWTRGEPLQHEVLAADWDRIA